MSRGLGKLQKAIVGQLSGKVAGPVYHGAKLTTAELADNLTAAGVVKDASRKVACFTVRRACDGLCKRGLVWAEMVWDEDHHARALSWKLDGKGER